jgi:hypothetical protein
MEATTILHPLVKRGQPPPIWRTGDGDDEDIRLAEQLADREDIPVDVAYSIVSRHHIAHLGATHERP